MSKDRSRSWMVTLPASEYDRNAVTNGLESYTYTGQMECGSETGYNHWQIYIENPNPIKFSTLRGKFPKGHFEVRTTTRTACWRYVHKTDTAVVDVERIGSMEEPPAEQGRDTTVDELRSKMLLEGMTARDLLLTEPGAHRHFAYLDRLENAYRSREAQASLRSMKVHYLYGVPGVGKTFSILGEPGAAARVFSVSSYANPFDSYNYEKTLLLDEFNGQLEFEFLLKLLDCYPLELPCRYANKWALFDEVWMVSNIPLSSLYPEVRRSSPAQWNALMRRIHFYEEMTARGVTVSHRLPVVPLGSKD